ncbi:MAG: hypothetical protein KJ044_10840 [Planctomycetes bacterium]|nr:hypothetical protein [Planctomycetota bacterium]
MIGNSGVLLVTFDLADLDSDLGSLNIEWSTDQAQTFTEVDQQGEILGNPPVNLLTSPGGSPGQFIWNSAVALSNHVGEFYLRFTAHDQPSGYSDITPASPVVAGPFSIDNSVNQPPVLQLVRSYAGQSFVASVPLDFTLADPESDAAAVIVKYTLNGGTTWHDCTLVPQFAPGAAGPFPTIASPTFYSIRWNALVDLQNEPGLLSPGVSVQLVFVPADSQAGDPRFTAPFTVIGNTAPAVTAVSVLNTFGNVPVIVRMVDESSDPVSVTVAYSTDGINFAPLSQSDFAFGSLSSLVSSPSGEDNVLIWNTSLVLPNQNEPAVYLRITPTDHPAGAAPPPATVVDLTGLPFTSAAFAIINDPAGAAPISITPYTTDSPATPPSASPPSSTQYVTVAPSGQRMLDRTIQPASAAITDVFWFIDEQNGDFGTLLTGAGTPLTHSTASLTCNGPGGIDGHTVTIDDVANGMHVFEFDDDGLSTMNHIVVDISLAASSDDVAAALAAAINAVPFFQITAQATGSDVTLTHRLAAKVTQSIAVAPSVGMAQPISVSGSAVTVNSDMQGGFGPQNVRYTAPATIPPGSSYVTLKCFIDHPSYVFTVQSSYRLYWGQQPTGVSISPSNPSILLGGTGSFMATVAPAGAPQQVTWEVVGGSPNGTITPGGFYMAPPTMPASNIITIKATSVLTSVTGTTQVTLMPEPTSVVVSAAGGVTQLVLSGGMSSTLNFSAQVFPNGAPQTVTWRIRHAGVDQGPGNSTVGTINTSGLYTAPNTLPSPDFIQIEAVSTVKPSVFGQYNLQLVAPAPTSFQVSPATVVIYSGGVGQQFNTHSFVPSNANQAVTWEVIPATGHGTVSSSGYYTPPFNVGGTTTVTVRAKSSVNQAVFADATITLHPNQSTIPTDVVVSPSEAIITAQTPQFIFSATVNPGTASQSVTWAVVAGPGTIDSGGRYTPVNTTDTDYVATVRATSTVSPFPFGQATVRVTGNGKTLQEVSNLTLGRNDHEAAWDPTNDRLWWIGGVSETSKPDADLMPLWYNTGADSFGSGPSLSTAGTISPPPKAIMAGVDTFNKKLYAFANMGSAQRIRVFVLNLAPIGSAWIELLVPSAGSDEPTLTANTRYPLFFDTTTGLFNMIVGVTTAYRFNPVTGVWTSRVTLGQTAQAPGNPLNNGWAWHQGTRQLWFVGPSDGTAGAAMKVTMLDIGGGSVRWYARTSVGQPAQALANPGLYLNTTTNTLWVFGGRNVATDVYSNQLSNIDLGVQPHQWVSYSSGPHWPMPRVRAAFAMTSSGTGPVLFAGGNNSGSFGDLWMFDESGKTFNRGNPDGLRPQGRQGACGVWTGSQGYVYGGACDHGASEELWTFSYQATPFRIHWSPVTTGPTKPPALMDATLLHDAGANCLLLYGGTTSPASKGSGASGQLWRLQLNTTPMSWTLLSPGGTPPSPRYAPAVCFSYTGGGAVKSMWVFGGEGSSGKLNDLWELDLSGGYPGTWFNRSISGGPDAREGSAIGFDSRRNVLVVLGGKTSAGPNHQYWEYNIPSPAWTARSPSNPGDQENFYRSGVVYEDLHRRFFHAPWEKPKYQALVVASGSPVNPTWHYMTSPGSEHAFGTAGLYDATNGRYYVVTGARTIGGLDVGTNGVRVIHVK